MSDPATSRCLTQSWDLLSLNFRRSVNSSKSRRIRAPPSQDTLTLPFRFHFLAVHLFRAGKSGTCSGDFPQLPTRHLFSRSSLCWNFTPSSNHTASLTSPWSFLTTSAKELDSGFFDLLHPSFRLLATRALLETLRVDDTPRSRSFMEGVDHLPSTPPSLWKDQSEVSLNGANRRLNKPPCLIRTSFQPVRPSSFIPNLAKLHLSSFLQQASTPSNNLGQANFPKSNPAREASSSLQDFSPQTTIYLNTNLEKLWIPILKH